MVKENRAKKYVILTEWTKMEASFGLWLIVGNTGTLALPKIRTEFSIHKIGTNNVTLF